MADEIIPSGSIVPPSGPLPPHSNPAGPAPSEPPIPSRYRPRPIFPGLALILIGTLLLVARLHPGMNLFYVITRFWPVLLILWGVSKLIERIGAPPRTPVVNGG